jgi:alkylation response protein AidB-like acyl-CoA dehydrogenase
MMDLHSTKSSNQEWRNILLDTVNKIQHLESEYFAEFILEHGLQHRIGLVTSSIVQIMCQEVVKQAKDHLPKKLINNLHCEIYSIANTERCGGTNLRLIGSKLENGLLTIEQKYSTNLGAADYSVCSFKDLDGDGKIKLAIVPTKFGKQAEVNSQLDGFEDGMTGLFEASNLTSDQYWIVPNSARLLQLCFNIERYLVSSFSYAVHKYLLDTIAKKVVPKNFSGQRLVNLQFIQDKIIKVEGNSLIIKGMLDNIYTVEGYDQNSELSFLKFKSIEMASESIVATIECLGKDAFEATNNLMKLHKDIQFLRFWGGSKELHKIIMADTFKRRYLEKN